MLASHPMTPLLIGLNVACPLIANATAGSGIVGQMAPFPSPLAFTVVHPIVDDRTSERTGPQWSRR